MRYPTANKYVSSEFGYRTHPVTGVKTLHQGTDFPLPGAGAALFAVRNFTLYGKGTSYAGGNWVALRLEDGVLAYYYHMQAPTHLTGGGMEGEIVGYMGSTGAMVTGPHLHFETRDPDGTPFDPIPYLNTGSPAGGGSTPFPDPDNPGSGEPPIDEDDDVDNFYFRDVSNANRPYRYFSRAKGKSRPLTVNEWEAMKAVGSTAGGSPYKLVDVSSGWYDKITALGNY